MKKFSAGSAKKLLLAYLNLSPKADIQFVGMGHHVMSCRKYCRYLAHEQEWRVYQDGEIEKVPNP